MNFNENAGSMTTTPSSCVKRKSEPVILVSLVGQPIGKDIAEAFSLYNLLAQEQGAVPAASLATSSTTSSASLYDSDEPVDDVSRPNLR